MKLFCAILLLAFGVFFSSSDASSSESGRRSGISFTDIGSGASNIPGDRSVESNVDREEDSQLSRVSEERRHQIERLERLEFQRSQERRLFSGPSSPQGQQDSAHSRYSGYPRSPGRPFGHLGHPGQHFSPERGGPSRLPRPVESSGHYSPPISPSISSAESISNTHPSFTRSDSTKSTGDSDASNSPQFRRTDSVGSRTGNL